MSRFIVGLGCFEESCWIMRADSTHDALKHGDVFKHNTGEEAMLVTAESFTRASAAVRQVLEARK
jgi:hypothetical protein